MWASCKFSTSLCANLAARNTSDIAPSWPGGNTQNTHTHTHTHTHTPLRYLPAVSMHRVYEPHPSTAPIMHQYHSWRWIAGKCGCFFLVTPALTILAIFFYFALNESIFKMLCPFWSLCVKSIYVTDDVFVMPLTPFFALRSLFVCCRVCLACAINRLDFLEQF